MKKLLTNVYLVSLFTQGSYIALGLLDSILINRFLGPALKGEYAYIQNIVSLLALLMSMGIAESYAFNKRKGISGLKEKYIRIFLLQFYVYILFSVLLSLLVHQPQVIIIAGLTPIMVLSHQLSFMAFIENTNLRNALGVIGTAIYTLIMFVLFITATANYFHIILLLYLEGLTTVLLLLIAYRIKLFFRFRSIDFGLLKDTLRFGIYPMFTGIMTTLNYRADILILKGFVDYTQIGYYTLGVGLASKSWMIPDAFKNVLSSKTAEDDAVEDILLCIKATLYINIALFLLIILAGRPLIVLLYGLEYAQAYGVTIAIFSGSIPIAFYKLLTTLFLAKGQQKISFYILLASVLSNIVSNFILIPYYGIIGAAVASVLSYSLCGFLFLGIFMKTYHLHARDVFIVNRREMVRIRSIFRKKGQPEDRKEYVPSVSQYIKELAAHPELIETLIDSDRYLFLLCNVEINKNFRNSKGSLLTRRLITIRNKTIKERKRGAWRKEMLQLRRELKNNAQFREKFEVLYERVCEGKEAITKLKLAIYESDRIMKELHLLIEDKKQNNASVKNRIQDLEGRLAALSGTLNPKFLKSCKRQILQWKGELETGEKDVNEAYHKLYEEEQRKSQLELKLYAWIEDVLSCLEQSFLKRKADV